MGNMVKSFVVVVAAIMAIIFVVVIAKEATNFANVADEQKKIGTVVFAEFYCVPCQEVVYKGKRCGTCQSLLILNPYAPTYVRCVNDECNEVTTTLSKKCGICGTDNPTYRSKYMPTTGPSSQPKDKT